MPPTTRAASHTLVLRAAPDPGDSGTRRPRPILVINAGAPTTERPLSAPGFDLRLAPLSRWPRPSVSLPSAAPESEAAWQAALVVSGGPSASAIDLLRTLRGDGITIPLLLLLSNPTLAEIVQGLEAGANDVIAAASSPALLAARLRSHLRAHASSESASFLVGACRFHPASRTLTHPRSRSRVRLTSKEAQLLQQLLAAPDQRATRAELLAGLWGTRGPRNSHVLETHVYRLRQKIGPDASARAVLVTEPGAYRLASD